MSEPQDDTTDGVAPSPTRNPLPSRHSYYDDDATGYEVYDPSKEDEHDDQDDDDDAGERRAAGPSVSDLSLIMIPFSLVAR